MEQHTCTQKESIYGITKAMDRMFDKIDTVQKDTTEIKIILTRMEGLPSEVSDLKKRVAKLEKIEYKRQVLVGFVASIISSTATFVAFYFQRKL